MTCFTGVPSSNSGNDPQRRCSLNMAARPAPPVRRTASMTGATLPGNLPIIPSYSQSQSGSGTPTPQNTPTESQAIAGETVLRSQSNSNSNMTHEEEVEYMRVQDLDLPPPPPELSSSAGGNVEFEIGGEEDEDLAALRSRAASVQDTHANVIQALNQQLINQPIYARPTGIKPQQPQQTRHSNTCSSEETTPTADPTRDTLLAQIQNGVKLKRSNANDRSTPHYSF